MSDFSDKIASVVERYQAAEQKATSEADTKNAVVEPFIRALGFDTSRLEEVKPEFTADVGEKHGEKVDYALQIDNKISVLIECKKIGTSLNATHINQLFRYFQDTDAKIAVLTNGREFRFFSDTEQKNKMDRIPFFTFDLMVHDKNGLGLLLKFCKEEFNPNVILDIASRLKSRKKLVDYLSEQSNNLNDEFVKFIAREIQAGFPSKAVKERLKSALVEAFFEVSRLRYDDTSNVASPNERRIGGEAEVGADILQHEEREFTESEEIAYRIIQAISAQVTKVNRVYLRNAKGLGRSTVILDNNGQKRICKFDFTNDQKLHIRISNKNSQEKKYKIQSVEDIYSHATEIISIIEHHIGGKAFEP